MGRPSADIIDYCNECLNLFPKSSIALTTMITIHLETLLPQLCEASIQLRNQQHCEIHFDCR